MVSIQPVSDFYSAAAVLAGATSTTFCVGLPGQLMYARAVYQAPAISSIYPLVGTFGPVSNGNFLVSAAAFANENPAGVLPAGANGC